MQRSGVMGTVSGLRLTRQLASLTGLVCFTAEKGHAHFLVILFSSFWPWLRVMPPSLNLPGLSVYTRCVVCSGPALISTREALPVPNSLFGQRSLWGFSLIFARSRLTTVFVPTPPGLVCPRRTYQGLNPGYSWETNFSWMHLVITRVNRSNRIYDCLRINIYRVTITFDLSRWRYVIFW